VWGSIAFALAVWGMGEADAAHRPALLLGGASLLYVAAAVVSLGLPRHHAPRRHRFGTESWAYLRRPRFLLFLGGTAAYYAGHATYDAFVSLHLEDLGADQATIGLAWAIGVSVEILIMFAAPRLFGVVRGSHVLVLCAGIAALRWFLLASVTTPLLVLLSQPLHGLTFGLWFLAFVDQAQERAPEELRTTVQTMASASMGIGMVAGYLGGGRLMDWGGTAPVFQAAVAAALLGLILYALRLRIR
jgi:predicted MFS family arabinose efflux permease